MAEINLRESNFDKEVLESDIPVMVDFWASWCAPCRMLAPTIAEIAEEYEGKVKVCKLNVDEAPGIARKYGINSIPAVLLFRDGKNTASSVGYVPKEQLTAMLG